jgi:hypothetical protein
MPRRGIPTDFDHEIVNVVPLVANIPHDERVIKADAVGRKHFGIRKIARFDMVHGERAYLPSLGLEPDYIESATVGRGGVSDTAAFEKGGRQAGAWWLQYSKGFDPFNHGSLALR